MKLAGIKFGEKHSYDDWNLALTAPGIPSAPTVNSYFVPINGANGFINYTERLTGEPTYKHRTGKFQFLYLGNRNDIASLYSEISSYLHGKSMQIVTDEDPNYYYTGFLKVEPLTASKRKVKLAVSYTLDPFKYEMTDTVISKNYSQATTDPTYHVVQMTDVSQLEWNTDLRAPKGINLTSSTGVFINVPANSRRASTTMQYVFYDGQGNTYSGQQTFSTIDQSGGLGWTGSALRTNLNNAGVDYTNITRVLCSYSGGCTLAVKNQGLQIDVTGCDRTVMPVITVPRAGMLVECNGVVAEAKTAGSQTLDGIVIPREGGRIVISAGSSGATSGTCSIRYRKAWL